MKLGKAIIWVCTAVVLVVAIATPSEPVWWFGVGCMAYVTWTWKD